MASGSTSSNVVGVHYRVGKKIGEGSFGVIFEGTNLLNQQQVAIKFEPRKSDAPQLRDEYRTYKILVGCRKFSCCPLFPHVAHSSGASQGTDCMPDAAMGVHCTYTPPRTTNTRDAVCLVLLSSGHCHCCRQANTARCLASELRPRICTNLTNTSQPGFLMSTTLARRACTTSWSSTCWAPVWRTCSTTATGSSRSRL
jgi:serine/threonine protein kinase